MSVLTSNITTKFKCLQADCPDTCCQGWSMQVDDITFEKYKGTELENAVSYDGDIRVMKRDKRTDFCFKFTSGICGIHKNNGEKMLGDACNFYPRITRKLGRHKLMSISLSCPEAARLSLLQDGVFDYTLEEYDRLPNNIIDWLPDGISADDALIIHNRFIDEAKQEITAATLLARIYSVSESLDVIEKKDWAGAVNFMFKIADGKLLQPEFSDMDDYNIFQSFLGILHATGKKNPPRLENVINSIINTLGVTVDFKTLNLTPKNLDAYSRAKNSWKNNNADFVLKNFIVAQISAGTMPFGGLGKNFTDRAMILAFKYALIKLALMSDQQNVNYVDIIQPICRVMDHLSDPSLILKLMEGFGWNKQPRLLALIFA